MLLVLNVLAEGRVFCYRNAFCHGQLAHIDRPCRERSFRRRFFGVAHSSPVVTVGLVSTGLRVGLRTETKNGCHHRPGLRLPLVYIRVTE